MLNIVHVVPSIAEEASGPSYSVPSLCNALVERGERVSLAALAWSDHDRRLPYLTTFPMDAAWPRRLGSSRRMRRFLNSLAVSGEPVIFHNHGMWQMNSLYPGWATRRSAGRCRLIVSPRGALSDWAMRHGSSAKKFFWPLLQRPVLQAAACFHATAEAEYEDIRRLGFRQPVAIIPNGIDVADTIPMASDTQSRRTVLFLGRIHKKKGLDLLLPAWTSLQDRFPGWRLVIAGDDGGYGAASGYLAQMRRLASQLDAQRVEFAGELRGEKKLQMYRRAEVFVLPTYSENFGLAVAEALASGTPAIVTRGAPWGGLKDRSAGWWVDVSQEGIAAALGDAMSRSTAELAQLGRCGQQWMREEFAWDHIAEKMSVTYQWLIGSLDQRPSWVMAQ